MKGRSSHRVFQRIPKLQARTVPTFRLLEGGFLQDRRSVVRSIEIRTTLLVRAVEKCPEGVYFVKCGEAGEHALHTDLLDLAKGVYLSRCAT